MVKKFGVYIPDDIISDLEKCMTVLGLKTRSKLIQEALRLFIMEHKWSLKGKAAGIIGILYNHETDHIDEILTDIQHKYLDIIISALHIHLDKEKCMLIIAVRGPSDKINELLGKIKNLKGVMLARPLLLSMD
ncbi:MAG: CopG family transcriptional regulator [Thermoprotei archaeon]|nr:MAG: CopG family transcriptional regulator [Thermoprotei archaeon]